MGDMLYIALHLHEKLEYKLHALLFHNAVHFAYHILPSINNTVSQYYNRSQLLLTLAARFEMLSTIAIVHMKVQLTKQLASV